MNKKSLAVILGASLVGSLAASPIALAGENPFAMQKLSSGYQVAMEGKCGEGKCGGSKAKTSEGKCGEGKCGGK